MLRDEVHANLEGVVAAQQRLETAIAPLDDETMSAASLCEGWTRGHVLSHVARNADALANLCHWATTGEVTPMYLSMDARAADIAEGAARPAAAILDDVVTTGQRVSRALEGLVTAIDDDPALLDIEVRMGDGSGPPILAGEIPLARRKELEVHHVDLAGDYRIDDWPDDFVDHALPDMWTRMSARMDDPPVVVAMTRSGPRQLVPGRSATTVTGPPSTLLAWLLGRAEEEKLAGLAVSPAGGLPTVPPY